MTTKMFSKILVLLLLIACNKDSYKIPIGSDAVPNESSTVKIEKGQDNRWALTVNGKSFQMKGAATNRFYTDVRKFGGNTIRLYSASGQDVKQILDDSYQSGLMVYMGLGMKAAKGFDYTDAVKVAEQKETVLSYVKRYMKHPAVLCWSLGNEIEASNEDNIDLWKAVGDLARSVKEIDPNHPVTCALAGSAIGRIRNLCKYAPDIDFISVNSYYPTVANIPANLKEAGTDLPYMVTEFGPRGTWAMGPEPSRILPWGDNYSESSKALVEETSTEKENIYLDIYEKDLALNSPNGCLGGFVFVWGYQTHGEVLNWYGTHTKDRYSFGVCDVMEKCWTGKYPEIRAPRIESRKDITLNGKFAEDAIQVPIGSDNNAKVTATNPSGVQLSYKWFIFKEGDHEKDGSIPSGIEGLITDPSKAEINFKAPSSSGAYRLYVYVLDDVNKKAASACIPFYVN